MNSTRLTEVEPQANLVRRDPRYTARTRNISFGRSVSVNLMGATSTPVTFIPRSGFLGRPLSERVHIVTADDQAFLSRVLEGDSESVNRLINRLTPIVQARVARKLISSTSQRDVRQDVKDYTQDVFLHLFKKQGQVFRGWQPERGMSLDNYVGLVTERRVISLLRSGKRNPWREREALENVDEPASKESDLEASAVHADTLNKLLDKLRQSLSPLGWQVFELLYINEKSVGEVQAQLTLSADAVYAWRSRLRKAARTCQSELNEQSVLASTSGSKSHE